jgi:hypothetical protein
MKDIVTIENIIEQINNLDLSIKKLKKDIKNVKTNKKSKDKKVDKIKRPLNSYMLYYTENYKKIKDENPGIISIDIAKICGKNWKNMKPNERHKYENKSNKEKEKYKKLINV